MGDVLVWFLVTAAYQVPVAMIGPFSDVESCIRVQNTEPIKRYSLSHCVQVKQPRSKNG